MGEAQGTVHLADVLSSNDLSLYQMQGCAAGCRPHPWPPYRSTVSRPHRRDQQMRTNDHPLGSALTRRTFLQTAAAGSAIGAPVAHAATPAFTPQWDSLAGGYRAPEWFRDAKFGIWAHWTAQCVPEMGDWYARNMYLQGNWQYEHHLRTYGHPTQVGFMEMQNRWKAEHWDPEALLDLYVKAGARYFVALANHHDNFDAYDSKYHGWNSVRVGPRRDIVGTWAKAARARGLRFGVSNHSAHGCRPPAQVTRRDDLALAHPAFLDELAHDGADGGLGQSDRGSQVRPRHARVHEQLAHQRHAIDVLEQLLVASGVGCHGLFPWFVLGRRSTNPTCLSGQVKPDHPIHVSSVAARMKRSLHLAMPPGSRGSAPRLGGPTPPMPRLPDQACLCVVRDER